MDALSPGGVGLAERRLAVGRAAWGSPGGLHLVGIQI